MKKINAIMLNMGIIREKNIVDYWSRKVNRHIPWFSKVMSCNRFQLISSMFHLSSSVTFPRNHPGYDPWQKIRVFYDYINNKLKDFFVPYQNVSIDESLIGMKNRCTFITYMPNKKHARYGIKKFELCDSKTSYVMNVSLYSGKDFLAGGDDPFTEKVVINEVEKCNLFNKWYHVFTDNFYTKLPLARNLFKKKTFISGTVNKRTKGLSKHVVSAKLGVQKSIYYRQGNILLVGYKQKKNRKPVYLLTTGCHAEDKIITSRSGLRAVKPVVINKYNLQMGGVDCSDKSIYHLSCTRPTKKYWKKIFFNLLDIAVFDAWVLYSNNTDKPIERDDFVDSIVNDLANEEAIEAIVRPNRVDVDESEHKLAHLPGRKERICVICATDATIKRQRSLYWCPGCNCGIHPTCYHLLDHYHRPTHKGRKRTAPDSDSD